MHETTADREMDRFSGRGAGLLCTRRNSAMGLVLGVGATSLAFFLVLNSCYKYKFQKMYLGNSYFQICKEILEMANDKSSNTTRESGTNTKEDLNNIL